MALGGFQSNAFQHNAFQLINRGVAGTARLPLPINCVMIGDQPLSESGKTTELFNLDLRSKTKILTSNVTRLSSGVSTFTSTTRKMRE